MVRLRILEFSSWIWSPENTFSWDLGTSTKVFFSQIHLAAKYDFCRDSCVKIIGHQDDDMAFLSGDLEGSQPLKPSFGGFGLPTLRLRSQLLVSRKFQLEDELPFPKRGVSALDFMGKTFAVRFSRVAKSFRTPSAKTVGFGLDWCSQTSRDASWDHRWRVFVQRSRCTVAGSRYQWMGMGPRCCGEEGFCEYLG